jgi:nucleotide-binding universal stress UspA family protein
MTIKRILVPLADSAVYTAEIDMAVSVAKSFGAYIEALYVHQKSPPRRAHVVDAGMYRQHGSSALATEMLSPPVQPRPMNNGGIHAQEAREQLLSACAAEGIRLHRSDRELDTMPSVSWRETEGAYGSLAARRAAAFDLVIAASASVMGGLKDVAEQSLLSARRPVLLAPSHLRTKFSDGAIIAWDESPECWHATSAAVPFLKLARSVRVMSIDRNAAHLRASHEDVLDYLRCHGVHATAEVIAPQPDLQSLGGLLLTIAADRDSGLLVMGAYSRSRLREMLLGGVTNYILRNASTRPVLMAH